jgi:hypothetical protein
MPPSSYCVVFVNPSIYPKLFLMGDVRIFRHLEVSEHQLGLMYR